MNRRRTTLMTMISKEIIVEVGMGVAKSWRKTQI